MPTIFHMPPKVNYVTHMGPILFQLPWRDILGESYDIYLFLYLQSGNKMKGADDQTLTKIWFVESNVSPVGLVSFKRIWRRKKYCGHLEKDSYSHIETELQLCGVFDIHFNFEFLSGSLRPGGFMKF